MKIKLIDKNGYIDCVYALFYASVIYLAFNPFLGLMGALACSILILVRDELSSRKLTKDEELEQRLQSLESDLTAVKMQQGIKNLR